MMSSVCIALPSSIHISHSSSSSSSSTSSTNIKKELCDVLSFPKIAERQPYISGKLRKDTEQQFVRISKDIELENQIEKLKARILSGKHPKSNLIEDAHALITDLAYYKEKRSGSLVDYSLEDNLFIRKGIKLLNQRNSLFQFDPQFELYQDIWENRFLSHLLHMTFEHCSDPAMFPLINKYDTGLPSGLQATMKLDSALTLLHLNLKSATPLLGFTSESEKNGLLRICQHRFNLLFYMYEYIKISNTQVDSLRKQRITQVVETIQSDIEALQTANITRVVILENGDTSFTIPGGWIEHYISFEFRRTSQGTYLFIIHNRGHRSDDIRLHGEMQFKIGDKAYRKTRIPIKVSKDVLMDKAFLHFLLTTRISSSKGQILYDKIHSYLIKKNGGKIVQSEQEKLAKPLAKLLAYYSLDLFTPQRERIRDMFTQILKSDPNYNSTPRFGTCSESNLATIEIDMAPRSTLLALKQYTIATLLNSVAKQYFLYSPTKPIGAYSTLEDLHHVVMDIENRTCKSHTSLGNVVEIRKLLDSWKALEKAALQLKIQNQRLKSESSEATAQILQLHINKKINDLSKTEVEIQTRIGKALKRYTAQTYEARSFYLHANKKLTKIQTRLIEPPKKSTAIQATDVYKMLEESVRFLVNQPINEERIKSLTQPELLDLHKKELTSLDIRIENIFEDFDNIDIFNLVTAFTRHTLAINQAIFERRAADLGEHMEEIRKDFFHFKTVFNKKSLLYLLSHKDPNETLSK